MSLNEPNEMVLSKMKYVLLKKFKDDPEGLEEAFSVLGPFPVFKVEGTFNDPTSGNIVKYDFEQCQELVEERCDYTDDIEKMMYFHRKVKQALRKKYDQLDSSATATVYSKIGDTEWKGIFLDAFPTKVNTQYTLFWDCDYVEWEQNKFLDNYEKLELQLKKIRDNINGLSQNQEL